MGVRHSLFAVAGSVLLWVTPAGAAPMTLDQLLNSLKLDKTALQFTDPESSPGTGDNGEAEAPVSVTVPGEFSAGAAGRRAELERR